MRLVLAFLSLLLGPRLLDAETLPPYERSGILALPADTCQELRIGRLGEHVLEVRFFDEPLAPVGPDPKTSGAALFLAASDRDRASFSVYAASGIYQQTSRLAGPIRWLRHGTELCVASGSQPIFCTHTASETLGTARIAFGPGWETEMAGCTEFALHERPRSAWVAAGALFAALAVFALINPYRRDVLAVAALASCFIAATIAAFDPWRLPSIALLGAGVLASGGLAVAALLTRRRRWIVRSPRIALAALALVALVGVPHPIWIAAPAEPVVPPLWLDTAHWHPRAPHQSLDFRGAPLAGVTGEAPTWLVLGGSVVFGDGVEASQTFTAVAQDLLRADGDRTVLLNAGMQGWTLANVDRFLSDLGDALPITGIVVVSILNNATLPIVGPRPSSCERSLLRAYLCNATRSQLLFTWPKVVIPKPTNPERYRATLRGLVERERSLGRRVVLIDEASELDGGIGLWDAEGIRDIARKVAAESGLVLHPIGDSVAALPPEERFLDGVHPTVALHALLGHALHDILREP